MKNEEEKKYKVSLSDIKLKSKPLNCEIGKISKNLKSVSLTYSELVECLTAPNSQTIAPSIYRNNQRNNKNWLSQQIFMLDFDGGLSKNEVRERFEKYGITPNFIYYTFSHTEEKEKFRVVLLMDTEVTDSKIATHIREGLLLMFPEADEKCKDAARMFFGGLYNEEWCVEALNVDALVTVLSNFHISSDKMQTRKVAGIRVPLYNYIRSTPFTSNPMFVLDEDEKLSYLKGLSKNKFDRKKCIEQVRILKDFDKGEWLHYPQLFGLATNLKWVKGGLSYMKKKMEKVNQKQPFYDDNAFAILSNMRIYNYNPQRLVKYSPYTEDHQFTDLIDAVKTVRGHIERFENIEKIDLCEAENLFINSIEYVFNSMDNYIYIIKVPTGMGKTRELLGLENVAICFNTHELKNEISKIMTVQHVVSPQVPEFDSKKLNDIIKTLYQKGLNKEAYKILRDVSHNLYDNYENTENDSLIAAEYLQKIKEAENTHLTVLSTHQRGVFDLYNHDTIIFDEDPINSILSTNILNINDLKKLANITSNMQLNKIVEELETAKLGECNSIDFEGLNVDDFLNEIAKTDLNSNVVDFLKSNFYIKHKNWENKTVAIHYINKRQLPENKKIIILSATASIDIYRKLYGERLKEVDISNVKNEGQVIQYTKKSFSKYSLKHLNNIDLKKFLEGKNVITFKKKKDALGVETKMHFGNCSGYDALKGKDIIVLGTPHYNPIQYLLFASAMGIDINSIQTEMREQRVEWNGFRFRFMTYDDPRLQKIQLGLIESELIQAVGRARTLRTNAKVEVFSNLPLKIADKFIENGNSF